jgi:hypothetical protein
MAKMIDRKGIEAQVSALEKVIDDVKNMRGKLSKITSFPDEQEGVVVETFEIIKDCREDIYIRKQDVLRVLGCPPEYSHLPVGVMRDTWNSAFKEAFELVDEIKGRFIKD